MNKLLYSIMLFSLIFSGCKNEENSSSGEQATEETKDKIKIGLALSEFGLGDQSFNDMQYNGLIEAYRKYDIEAAFLVPADDSDESYIEVFQKLIEQEKCNMVFACEGFKMVGVANEMAKSYTNIVFVIMDEIGENLPNIVSAVFAQNEGSFVVGVLAALTDNTGKIGFIGGVNIPVVMDFEIGFEQGIHYINPDLDVEIEYCSYLPDFSGFNLPETGYAIARSMYSNGIDIIYSVAGATGNGIIQAARDTSNYVIGVDSNQDHMAPGFVLTSMMKRLDVAVETIVGLYIDGNLTPGTHEFNYHNDGISLTEMEYTIDSIPETTLTQVREAEEAIRNGSVIVNKVSGQ